MATYELHQNGSERYAKLSSFRADLVLNGHDNITAFILPTGGSPEIRFELDDEVELLKDSVAIAGGIVTHVGEEMEPEGGPNNNGRFLSRITVSGWGEITSRRHVTISIAGGSPGTTVSAFLSALIALDLGADGVTLHPSQSAGDVLPAMTFEDELPSSILNRIALIAGMVWRIDEQKRLRMWAKGDIASAFDIIETDLPAKYFGDIRPSRARFEGYANRVIVKGTKQTILDYGEPRTSDGVQTVFTGFPTMIGNRAEVIKVSNAPSLGIASGSFKWETVTLPGSADPGDWELDLGTGTFTRLAGPLPSGAVMRFIFDAEVSPRGVANDVGDQGSPPTVRDEIVHAPVDNDADAQALADQILPYLVAAKETKASYSTRETDLILPGDTQTMTVPKRNLSGSFLVERVVLRSGPGELNTYLVQDIETTQNQILKGDWRDLLNQFTVGPSGSTVNGGGGDSNNTGGNTVTNPDGDGGQGSNLAIPPPDKAVFFNRKGAIGTDPDGNFIYDYVNDSEVGGSPDVSRRSQLRLQSLSNAPTHSLQKWQSLTGGSPANPDGVLALNVWDNTFPGELFSGAEFVDNQYIARSDSVMFLGHQADGGGLGDGYCFLVVYANQTQDSPVDFSDFTQISVNHNSAVHAGGEVSVSGSAKPALLAADKIAIRDQLGSGNFGVTIAFAGTHTADFRELRFQMGDTTRTIRFDGVGSAVTFT